MGGVWIFSGTRHYARPLPLTAVKKITNLLTSFEPMEHKLFLKQNNERRGGICPIFLLDSEDFHHGIFS